MNIREQHTPRWIVFVIDILIVVFSIFSAFFVRFNFNLGENEMEMLKIAIPVVIGVRTFSFLIFRTYAGLIRFTSAKDAERIFVVVSFGSFLFFILNAIYIGLTSKYLIPLSIIIIDFLATVFTMTASRLFIKFLYHSITSSKKNKLNVVIYGTGQLGLVSKRTLDQDVANDYNPIGFIDPYRKDVGKKLEGLDIYDFNYFETLIEKFEVEILIIADQEISAEKKNSLVEICLNANVKVLSIPNVETWINGELSFKQMKEIKIEDLLERDPINLNMTAISDDVQNKVVLVTGAAGSIGSEMVRQITKFRPKKIILFDQAESPLYDLDLELKEKIHFFDFEIVIGNITNTYRLKKVFEVFHPKIVYHAAAFKHVPMMENNPTEAVFNNIWGTKNVADLSVEYKVKKFVMVSTDKAVNPTNVMGASKRISEIYCQSLNNVADTNFITTRFGNVLGSNGSVIPRFKRQIEKGGPITVTHPDITRFFMTIPEACQLVLEAGALGKGGEIFIFDMGQSVKIVDLAKKMIKLSGLTLGKDIQINFTGLRPGEKLYEELLNDKENTLPTHHEKIMIAKVRTYPYEEVKLEISELINMLPSHNNFALVRKMKTIVPEFISRNSVYEQLDKSQIKASNESFSE